LLQKSTDQIVIKPRVPLVVKLMAGTVLSILIVASHWYVYRIGLDQVDVANLENEKKELQQQIGAMRQRNEILKESIARAERQLQIDATAYAEISTTLEKSAKQINELHEELIFYRSIISPLDNRAGIQIQELSIQRSVAQHQYHYTLVLIQALKHDKLVHGVVNINVEGVQEGKKKLLKSAEIGIQSDRVKFKYFQNLEGVIELPGNFMPVRVQVSVRTSRKNARILERWYPWPSV